MRTIEEILEDLGSAAEAFNKEDDPGKDELNEAVHSLVRKLALDLPPNVCGRIVMAGLAALISQHSAMHALARARRKDIMEQIAKEEFDESIMGLAELTSAPPCFAALGLMSGVSDTEASLVSDRTVLQNSLALLRSVSFDYPSPPAELLDEQLDAIKKKVLDRTEKKSSD